MWYKVKKIYIGTNLVYPISPKAYYPLVSNANDASWKWNNASWVWTASYTTVWGKASAHFTRNNNYINTGLTPWSWPITIACQLYYTTPSWSWEIYTTAVWSPLAWNGSSSSHIWFCFLWKTGTYDTYYRWAWHYNEAVATAPTLSHNTWHFVAIRIDSSWNIKLTTDSSTTTWTTAAWNITDTIYIWAWIWNRFSGNVRDVAIWDRSISDEELQRFKTFIWM